MGTRAVPEDGRRDKANASERTQGEGRGCRWTDGVAAATVDGWGRSGAGTGGWKGMRVAADGWTTTTTDVGRSSTENLHPVAYSESSANWMAYREDSAYWMANSENKWIGSAPLTLQANGKQARYSAVAYCSD